MRGEVCEVQWYRFSNDYTQNAMALRECADRRRGLGVDSNGDEVSQMGMRLVEHAKGAIVGARKVSSSLDDVSEYPWEVDIGLDEQHGFDERLEASRIGDSAKGHEP